MKKVILLFVAILIGGVAAQAQHNDTEMFRQGKNLYLDGQVIKSERVLELLGSDAYYETYLGARKQYDAGTSLIVCGGVLASLGIAASVLGIGYVRYNIVDLGIYSSLFGGCMVSAGVPLLCIGKDRLRWCTQDYNVRAHKEPAVSLNFGPQSNGTGLALRF